MLFSLLTKKDSPPLQTDINNAPDDSIVYSGIYVDENPTPAPIPDTPVDTKPDEITPSESNRITVLLPPFVNLQEWQEFAKYVEEDT